MTSILVVDHEILLGNRECPSFAVCNQEFVALGLIVAIEEACQSLHSPLPEETMTTLTHGLDVLSARFKTWLRPSTPARRPAWPSDEQAGGACWGLRFAAARHAVRLHTCTYHRY